MTNNANHPTAPRPPAPPIVADRDIVDPATGEVIAQAGDALDDDTLARVKWLGWNVSHCPHYGEELPAGFTGCVRCLIASACYDEYVRAQDRAREAQATYQFGDIVRLTDGLRARVVADTGGEMILVSVIINGWGDPMSHVYRSEIIEEK